MSLLLEEFEGLLTTPEAVEVLDAQILRWAVQGELVTQNLEDEPVKDLLKGFKKQKDDLITKGIIRKKKASLSVKDNEIPYPIPEPWEWVRIPDVVHNWGQNKPDKKFTYIDVSSIDNSKGVIGDEIQIIEAKDAPSRARKLVKPGTVIYSTVRPYLLNIAIVNKEYSPVPIASTAFYVMHPFDGLFNKYLYYYLRSAPFIEFVESEMTGMAYPAISDSKMEKGLVPLPPLAEQKRIVAKVEGLLAQTAAIKERLIQAEKEQRKLNQSALAHLTGAETPAEFADRWAFIKDNFDLLYTHPENVAELKQSILQLAVQGRLVKQDPSNEPASELLNKIKVEKAQLAKEGEIKKSKTLPKINENEIPFELPSGWKWTYLDNVVDISMGQSPPGKSYNDTGEGIPLINGPVEFGKGPFSKTIKSKFTTAPTKMCQEGDLLVCVRGSTTGRTNIAGFDACIGRGVAAIRAFAYQEYINYFMLYYRDKFYGRGTGSTFPSVSLDKIRNIFIPFPPIQEQKRIVEKVKKLHELCDELEAGLVSARESHARVVRSVLGEAG